MVLPVDLPPLALISLGITLAVIFAINRFGFLQGKTATPASSSQAQVAAVIVDPTALNAAAAEVAGLAVAVHELVVVMKEAAQHTKKTADELDRVREEIRITRERDRR